MSAESFRPALTPEQSRDVHFLAAAVGITPVAFVRACVRASVEEIRARHPEMDRALSVPPESVQAVAHELVNAA